MRPVVLVIAGTDSSGGAGLLRDVQVLTQLDTEARCVVTAVTAQSHTHLSATHYVPPGLVREQMRAALALGGIGAIKVGMLGAAATVEAIAAMLPSRDHIPIVLDPVLRSSAGGLLLEEAAQTALRELLLPQVTLVTPNLPESAQLLNEPIATDETAVIEQARRILRFGSQAVLLKGGHSSGEEAVDLLLRDNGEPTRMVAARINASLRGTGCALSSAIAASLARGTPLVEACQQAKRYVWRKLKQVAERA
jgi:hydroxymethylpyrimidine/phosphomethylpyrimidine kinase